MAIRKELIDKQCLRAVISMPAGVFQPYSGVSTAILIFTKTDAGGTDNVWFYEMHADGFTLNAKRTPTTEDDIPDLLQRWQNLEAESSRTRKDQSLFLWRRSARTIMTLPSTSTRRWFAKRWSMMIQRMSLPVLRL